VATVALNAAQNAGILAAQILSIHDPVLQQKIIGFKKSLSDKVMEKVVRWEEGFEDGR